MAITKIEGGACDRTNGARRPGRECKRAAA